MAWISIFTLISILFSYTEAACNMNVGTDPLVNSDVRQSQEPIGDSGILVILDAYEVTCACGILTEWSFFAMGSGTIQLFVLRPSPANTIIGSSSFYVPPILASGNIAENYFHVALSREMWISVQSGDKLGFFNEGSPPMITFKDGTSSAYRHSGKTSLPSSISGGALVNRQYAVMAKIEDAKPPFFLNLPYTTTLYTHQTGTIIHTYSVTDLDPQDVGSLTVTDSGNGAFIHDPVEQTITYNTKIGIGTYTIDMTVQDTCGNSDTQSITVTLLDEPPYFNNLPAGNGATITEISGVTAGLPFTISVTDPSGDVVTCSIHSVEPNTGEFTLGGGGYDITYTPGVPIPFKTTPFYDILISCQDLNNIIKSNFVVDIVKNQPPSISNLPDSVLLVDTNNIPASIKTITANDPDGDTLTFSLTCTSSSGPPCPFSINPTSGEITAGALPDAGYDIVVTVTDDAKGNTDEGKLTVTVTGFTSGPVFTNLPATRNIVEGTPAGSYLYKVNYKDENIFNTWTLSKTAVSDPIVDTYIDFDVATGIVSVKAEFDFEALSTTTGLTMDLQVTDDSGDFGTGTMTFNFENKNEGPTITIGTPAISANEGPKDTVFTPNPAISASDPDAGDTANLTFSINCGAFSKYFYLKDSDMQIYFSREYDRDSGLTDTVSCNVTVTDPKGLTDTGSLTLTINAVNDYEPKFPQRYYTFFLTPSDTFLTLISDIAAYDNDSTNDVLTYTLGNPKSGTAGDHFMIDAAGILYVKDVSSFSLGTTYYFDVIATDTDSNPSTQSGSAQVFVIFSDVAAPDATTTTERSFTFKEDSANYAWLTVVGIVVLALLIVIMFIIYLDPPVRKAIARRILRTQKLFKKKPREPKQPKRYPVGKLKVAIGHKVLESDPDSKLPWELLASDPKPEGTSKTKTESLKPVQELKIISGVPRVTSVEAEVHSSSSGDKEGSEHEESSEGEEGAGEDQWGDLGGNTDKAENKTNTSSFFRETDRM